MAALPNSCENVLQENKRVGRIGSPSWYAGLGAKTGYCWQSAVEGTHRDLVQVVLTLNHWTTLLTGSAAYSLQDTLHQYTSHCSNHGRPREIDKMFTLLKMCHSALWSCHNIIRQWPSHSIWIIKTRFSLIPPNHSCNNTLWTRTCVFVKQTLRN